MLKVKGFIFFIFIALMMGCSEKNRSDSSNQDLSTKSLTNGDCISDVSSEFEEEVLKVCKRENVEVCSQSVSSFLGKYPNVNCNLKDEDGNNHNFFLKRSNIELIPKIFSCGKAITLNTGEGDNDAETCDTKTAEDFNKIHATCEQAANSPYLGEAEQPFSACRKSIDEFLKEYPDFIKCKIEAGKSLLIISRIELESSLEFMSCVDG